MTSSLPTSSRRRGQSALATVAALGLTLLAASAALPAADAQWVVETNSLRILEPSSVAGRHDAAIGDVSRCFFLSFCFFLISFSCSSPSPSSLFSQPLFSFSLFILDPPHLNHHHPSSASRSTAPPSQERSATSRQTPASPSRRRPWSP